MFRVQSWFKQNNEKDPTIKKKAAGEAPMRNWRKGKKKKKGGKGGKGERNKSGNF